MSRPLLILSLDDRALAASVAISVNGMNRVSNLSLDLVYNESSIRGPFRFEPSPFDHPLPPGERSNVSHHLCLADRH